MGRKESRIGKTGGGTGTRSGSSAKGQASATQRRLEEIQLARLSARLREFGNSREVFRALGEDPDRYASQLARQYADLSLKRREPPSLRALTLPAHLAAALDRLADLFNWWSSVLAPNATVGLTQSPGTADTDGVGVGSVAISQGSISLGGEIWNAGTQERWWVNTWQYIVPLPLTPSTLPSSASLSYRFNVGANVAFYRQDVVTGSVHVYATVATTDDLSTHPIDFNHPASSDFVIVADLPTAGVPPILSGSAKIVGTMPVLPGRTPAIGIIIGLIISVADGDVQIIPGEYSSIGLAPPDATMPSDLGRIEYHLNQPFWVDAVAQMLAS